MLSKEEYIELYVKGGQAINAILEVLNNLAEVKVEIAGEEAIKIIRDFQQKYFDLINEHFKPKELSDSNDELRGQLYFCEPYKFEDLKPNMWVYDIKVKWLFKIVSVDIGIEALKHYVFIVENRDGSTSLINFEENRFFPVLCANLES